MTSRKKPGVAFWATVVVVVPLVVYPLSFGPAIWLCYVLDQPYWLCDATAVVYDPLIALAADGGTVGRVYLEYIGWWESAAL